MEIWLSIIIGAMITGACAGIAIYATGRQRRAGVREMGFYIERAIKAIHANIKASQEKT
jgi:hypothetical protein